MKYLIIIILFTSCATKIEISSEQYLSQNYDKTLPLNLDMAFIYHEKVSKVDLEEFKRQFEVSQEIFNKLGVKLHLTYIKRIKNIPHSWHKQSVMISKGKQPDEAVDFYDGMEIKKFALTKKSEKIFDQLVDGYKGDNNRTIFILALNDIYMSYYEKGIVKELKVGALSFPGYIFADRIPIRLRGIITTQNVGGIYKTLAHELGHKLFNVSHEGLDICPKFSGNNIPGLMGYGKSLAVYKGKKGRFHKERLLRSPFLYRMKNKSKLYNQDYKKNGIYRDPIYSNISLNPACS